MPADLLERCLPVTGAYFETCVPHLDSPDEYHIYTDGSSRPCERVGLQTRDATWAMLVIAIRGRQRSILGWTGGYVRVDPEDRRWIGADDLHAMNAERTAIYWAMAWSLGQPAGQRYTLHVDHTSFV